ncbi:hypothetical protein AB0J68_01480 [Micromonospora sp. NPDC049580]|uniref:hypothetical protein n=1 Tax=Micromonospora sp. NPDC049580 TaxID=3154832 RepID=UPI00343E31AC
MPAYPRAHVMRNSLVTIATDEYAQTGQVTKARLVPDTPVQTKRTLVPDGVVQDIDSTVWSFELAGLQDYGTDGLAKALADLAGTQVTVTVQPKAGSGQDTAEFVMVAMPVEFGGEQGNFREFDATFPVVGQPEFSQSGA